MFEVTTRGTFRRTHEATDNGAAFASIGETKREGGIIEVQGARFTVTKEKSKLFVLTDETVQASATLLSGWKPHWSIACPQGPLTLRKTSAWHSDWELLAGETVLGRLNWRGVFKRTAVVNVDQQVPLSIQLFAYYLVDVVNRRSAAAAASGGGGG